MIRKLPVFVAVLSLAATGLLALAQSCGPWEVVPSPHPPGAESAIIRDITAITPDDAWAVGDWWGTVNGTVQTFAFTMHWDGAQRTLISTPQPAPCDVCHNLQLYGVDATGPDDVTGTARASNSSMCPS
jgi:hypothetical protein